MKIVGTSRSGHNFVKDNIESWTDSRPGDIENPVSGHFDNDIICIRDYLDTIASLAKIKFADINKSIESWIFLANLAFNSDHPIVIFYEKFKNSEKYRRKICTLVKGKYNEDKLLKLPKGGSHSSFDGYEFKDEKLQTRKDYKEKFEDHANLMQTESRWLQIQENPKDSDYYISKLQEFPAAIQIYKKIYNLNKEKILFLKNINLYD